MSIPTNATLPDMPTGTSNPSSWKGWFTRIGSWINGMSPAGASAYDSGPLAVIPGGVFTAPDAAIRRQGRRAIASGALVASSPATFTSAFVKIGTLPASGSLRPPSSRFYSVGVFGAGHLQVQMTASGDINVRALQSSVTLATGASIYLDGMAWDL